MYNYVASVKNCSGTGIRTPIAGTKTQSPTIRRSPNVTKSKGKSKKAKENAYSPFFLLHSRLYHVRKYLRMASILENSVRRNTEPNWIPSRKSICEVK